MLQLLFESTSLNLIDPLFELIALVQPIQLVQPQGWIRPPCTPQLLRALWGWLYNYGCAILGFSDFCLIAGRFVRLRLR